MIEKMKFENMTYLLRCPKDFDENKKYPRYVISSRCGEQRKRYNGS